MTLELKVLKATLLFIRLRAVDGCPTRQSKEELRAEFIETYGGGCGFLSEADLEEWIDSMKDDLSKTPEEREEEARRRDAETESAIADCFEAHYARRERDEWDDRWDDLARSCGATLF